MFPSINKKETGVNLRRIMDMRGVKPKDIQEYLGFGCVQSVYRWLDGVSMPTVDNLYAISKMLQVPSILGKDSKTKDDKPLGVVDAYVKENTTELVDPLDIKKKIESLEEKNNRTRDVII